jgi:hypothetical protein
MNPFLEDWPRLHRHYLTGCPELASFYVHLKNAELPRYVNARGRMVVVAGRQGIGGKSVLSHQLLHQYANNADGLKLRAVDLSAPQSSKGGDVMLWLRRAVKSANVTVRLIGNKEAEEILRQDDLEYMSVTFGRALANEGYAAVIRIPFDESLLMRAVADDIARYAESAHYLVDSLYVYEYGYYDDDDLGKLHSILDAAQVDNVRIIQAPPLLGCDAERFAEDRLSAARPDAGSGVRTAASRALRDLAGGNGLELDIAGLNHVMREAFKRAERDGFDYFASYIEAEYKAYLERRRRPRDGGHV